MALPWHLEFRREEITFVHDWVQGGGGLFLLGFYLADVHHETNSSALARALGFSFRNDIVMPPGRTSRRECQDQGFDTTGEFAVPVRVPSEENHPISRNVRELDILSSCSIDVFSAPQYKIAVQADSSVVVEATGRMDADGYLRQIFEYLPTSRTEPTILAAWHYGMGRVVASGTWKLFTLDRRDNVTLVKNAIAWLGKHEGTS
jgi:hypothetical protein